MVKVFLKFENYMISVESGRQKVCQKNSAAFLHWVKEKFVSIWVTFQCSDIKKKKKERKNIAYENLQPKIKETNRSQSGLISAVFDNLFFLFNYFLRMWTFCVCFTFIVMQSFFFLKYLSTFLNWWHISGTSLIKVLYLNCTIKRPIKNKFTLIIAFTCIWHT